MSTPAPAADEVRAVVAVVGRVLVSSVLLVLPPLVLALASGEHTDASALAAAGALAVLLGTFATRVDHDHRRLRVAGGMVAVAAAWLVVPAVLGVAFLLSGHTVGWLDSWFDAMSGLTTSGLTLVQDLDHLGAGMQLFRHVLHFAGGQGIVVVLLTLLPRADAAGALLAGEGRDEHLVPSVMRTARLIWLIAGVWLVVGTVATTAAVGLAGAEPLRALLHGLLLFMAAFDTGGFSMMSTSIAYYHSTAVEAVVVVLMVAGALSFAVHWRLWRGEPRNAAADLDLRTFALTSGVLCGALLLGLAAHGTYDGVDALVRRGLFTAISAATGTGFAVVPGSSLGLEWGALAPGVLVVLMGLGAMAGSTAGGVKGLRVGVLLTSVAAEVRRVIGPPSSLVVATRRNSTGRRLPVHDAEVRRTTIVASLFVLTYLGGGLVLLAHGSSLEDALFESVSATATVGLSTGVAVPSAPGPVKLVLLLQMWLGRLEFMAAFALLGWGVLGGREAWRRSVGR